jgi:ankyrin repeat protein
MNKKAFTPLQFADKKSHEDIVLFLLKNGFCVNIQTNFRYGANPPLHLVLGKNHEKTTRLLVAKNAFIEQERWNFTKSLHGASNEHMASYSRSNLNLRHYSYSYSLIFLAKKIVRNFLLISDLLFYCLLAKPYYEKM